VTLTSADGRRLESHTGTDGGFMINDVPAGSYTLRVDAQGFSPWSQTIATNAAALPLVINLRLAGVSESVNVIGAAPATLARRRSPARGWG
jgi:carboxypeptidase family protein